MPRAQGMIQRLEQFTSKLSDSDDKQILRLRHGKIRKGAYHGTRSGRFKHWIAKLFLSKEQKEKRIRYLQAVTSAESVALAKELCADISKRTPIPYRVDREVTVKDVKMILEASGNDRKQFSRTVRQFVSSSATLSTLRDKPVDAARKGLEQSLMNRSIRHHDQMKQLHKEAIQLLEEQKRTKKSRRKPLVDGGAPLDLTNFKTLKKEIDALVQEKMLSLALFREAQEYAMKEQRGEPEATPQMPVPEERRHRLLKDFVESTKPEQAPRKSIALLAAEHMLQNGFEVDQADIPTSNSSALNNEISRLRERKTAWANEVANLLEAGKFKEARIVEDLTRDSEAMRLLGGLRGAFADTAWDKFLKKQRKKIQRGKKLQNQNPQQKKIRRRGPNLRKIRPQTHFDLARPGLGDHTRVATAHAKQMISRPKDYDGNIQDKESIIEQTLAMLQSKYRELSRDHNAFQLQEIRDYLDKIVYDRHVAVVEPVIRVKNPLEGVPLDTVSISGKEAAENIPFSASSDSEDGNDVPEFDFDHLEMVSVTSTDSALVAEIDQEELEDDVFEPETKTEGLNSLNEPVSTEKEKRQAKSVSDQNFPQDRDDHPG